MIENKNKKALDAYRDTINRIDDFFEYRNESKKDRKFIHEQLDKLSEKMEKIYSNGAT